MPHANRGRLSLFSTCSTLAGFLALAFFPDAAGAQCAIFTQLPFYDFRQHSSDIEKVTAFTKWLRQVEFRSYAHAKSVGLELGFEIDDILATLGFEKNEQGFEQFMFDLETREDFYQLYRERLMMVEQTINSKMVDALDNCLNGYGVRAWYELNPSDPRLAVIRVRYNGMGGAHSARLTSFSAISGSSKPNAISCNNPRSRRFLFWRFHPKLETGNTLTVQCTRADSAAASVTMNTNRSGVEPIQVVRVAPMKMVIWVDSTVAFSSNQPLVITPPRTDGDNEFGGHGPSVTVRVWYEYDQGSNSILARLYMKARETKSDYTTVEGETSRRVYSLPPNSMFGRFSSQESDIIAYTDDDHEVDAYRRGAGPVERVEIIGDTKGHDVGRTMTTAYLRGTEVVIRVRRIVEGSAGRKEMPALRGEHTSGGTR